MIYAEYFGLQVKNFGVPKLNVEQFQRMMNIIHIEGIILGMSESGEPDRYYTKRYRQTKSFNELTKRLSPEKVYAEMVRLSEKK
ncbi:MAG: hypothetical protein Q8O62_04380 [Aequorivita sp.]|nr:hypothetical protein [Aequorivita sp.]